MSDQALFGTLADGSQAFLYTLRSSSGMSVAVTNYGATVVALLVPDRHGRLRDVTLGYDTLDGYVRDRAFTGAVVGRYGNRIAGGRFTLDGTEYRLGLNDGRNHLHGGPCGFHKKLWRTVDAGAAHVVLELTSPDGEEGYPGTVTLRVSYRTGAGSELAIDYEGNTDRPTILNPTHHSYFNLSGDPRRTILDHLLRIDADAFTPVDAGMIPTGECAAVEGTPMDFRTPAAIGSRIGAPGEQLRFGRGYDHNWVLRGYDGSLRTAAELSDPAGGLRMTLLTDQPGLQFYSGNMLDSTAAGKGGIRYGPRTALCLEAQHHPDTPNRPQFPPVTLRPGDVYRQKTVYRFAAA